MKKIMLAGIFLMAHVALFAQDITQNISQRQAYELKKSFTSTVEDSLKTDILLRLALYNILKPGSEKRDLDSARNFIRQAEPIVGRLKSPAFEGLVYYVKANLQRETGDVKSGKQFAEKAVANLRGTWDGYHIALAYYELAQYVNIESGESIKERTNLVELSINALQHSTHIQLKAFLLKNLAELYSMATQNTKALQTIRLSLESYQSIHYPKLQSVYAMQGSINYSLGNYHEALANMFSALSAAENEKDTTMQLCQIYNIIGIIYYELSDQKSSIPYLRKALEIAQRNKDENTVYFLASNLVASYGKFMDYKDALLLLGRVEKANPHPAESNYIKIPIAYLHVYNNLRQFHKSGIYVTQVLQLQNRLKLLETSTLNNIYNEFVIYYTQTRQFNLAHKFILLNEKLAEKIREPQIAKQQQFISFQLDSAEGNYKGAMNHLIKFRKLNDSLFTEKKSKQINQLEIEYQTEKKETQLKIKDQSIRLLQQKEQIQQRDLRNAYLVKDITFGGIFLLFLILVLLYRQYRLKQKSNQIVEQNNVLILHKNHLLENHLKEKEWLLKEVHHRVKNNLHTVICLLESQAIYLENDALKAIENSQHRIYAMSLIHQKLYQSDDVKTIDMSLYLPEFIQYLNDSFGTQRQVRFHLMIEPLQLGVSQAIPLALIINEAVTNSIKYAFPDRVTGIITISMRRTDDLIELTIADNGVGISPTLAKRPPDSLGLKLMNGLSDDINAQIRIDNDKGTRITVVFEVDPLNEGVNFMNYTNKIA